MKQLFLLLIWSVAAFAQTPPPPKIRAVDINGSTYIEIAADQQNKALVKARTEKSENEQAQPTVNNEYDRLPVFTFKTAIAYQVFSNQEMSGTSPQGKAFHPNESNSGAGFDYGFAFRIPTSGPARRLNTGFLFNISKTETPGVLEEHADYIRNGQDGVFNALFSQWTLFSEYDVLIFRGRNTKAFSVGAYYDKHDFETSTCCFDLNQAYRSVHDIGGVARMRFIRSDGRAAFSRWEVSVYAGQGKTVRVTIGVDHIWSKRKINDPEIVVK